MSTDPLRRFVSTPIEATFTVCGVGVRFQTNSQAVADQLARALESTAAGAPDGPRFVCRVVAESDTDCDARDGPQGVHRLSHDGLAFVRLGHQSFVACDQRSREAIAFIPERWARDARLFRGSFLPALIALLRESVQAQT